MYNPNSSRKRPHEQMIQYRIPVSQSTKMIQRLMIVISSPHTIKRPSKTNTSVAIIPVFPVRLAARRQRSLLRISDASTAIEALDTLDWILGAAVEHWQGSVGRNMGAIMFLFGTSLAVDRILRWMIKQGLGSIGHGPGAVMLLLSPFLAFNLRYSCIKLADSCIVCS